MKKILMALMLCLISICGFGQSFSTKYVIELKNSIGETCHVLNEDSISIKQDDYDKFIGSARIYVWNDSVEYNVPRFSTRLTNTQYEEFKLLYVKTNLMTLAEFGECVSNLPQDPIKKWKDVILDYSWGNCDDWGIKQIVKFYFSIPNGQTKTCKKFQIVCKFYNNIDEYLGSKTFETTGYLKAGEEASSKFEFYAPSNSSKMKISSVITYFTDGTTSKSYNTESDVISYRIKSGWVKECGEYMEKYIKKVQE